MSHAYRRDVPIPQGLPGVLKEFARAAIKEQPNEINEWALRYFERVVEKEKYPSGGHRDDNEELGDSIGISVQVVDDEVSVDGSTGSGDSSQKNVQEALEERLSLLFMQADVDGNGTLSRHEFLEVFGLLVDELNLSESDIIMIMSEVDEDDNGVIDWKEFVPIATDLVRTLIAKQDYQERKRARHGSAKEEARDFLLKGLTAEELHESILEVFRAADEDDSGELDRKEFLLCLRQSGLGFTRRELNAVMTMVDRDGNGTIDYEEFMPVCINMLVEVIARQIEEVPKEEEELANMIQKDILQSASKLPAEEVISRLLGGDLGLTRVQVYAVVSDGKKDDDGLIDAAEVARIAAGYTKMLSKISWRNTKDGQGPGSATQLREMTREKEGENGGEGEFKWKLEASLQSRGITLEDALPDEPTVCKIIGETFPELGERKKRALMLLVHNAEEGGKQGSWRDLQKWGFKTLREISQHDLLMGIAASSADLHTTV